MVGSKGNIRSGIIGSGGNAPEMRAQSIQMVMNSRSQLSDASIDKVLMNQNFWLQEGLPSDRDHPNRDLVQTKQGNQSHVRINVPEPPSNHIRSIDEGYASNNQKPPKSTTKYEYDPETDKIIMIQKDLGENPYLREVTVDSHIFQSEHNRDFGERFEQDIDKQVEEDFSNFNWEKCPAKKHIENLTTAEFNLMEALFKNPQTSLPPHLKHPIDEFRFTTRKPRGLHMQSGS